MRRDVSDSNPTGSLVKKLNRLHHIRHLCVRTSSLIVLKSQTKCEACHCFKPSHKDVAHLCYNLTTQRKINANT